MLVGHSGFHQAWRHSVHVDVEFPKLDGERPRHCLNAGLRRRVVGALAIAPRSSGGDQDDLSIPSWGHHRSGRLGAEERSFQVGVDDLVPFGFGDVLDGVEAKDASTCNHEVNLAKAIERRLEHGINRAAISNITGHR